MRRSTNSYRRWARCLGDARNLLVGAALIGPLGWGTTIYLNDLNDIGHGLLPTST